MPRLTKAGIVKSQRGVGGGYALARQPQDISLLDVIEAIEGHIQLNRCLEDEYHCSKQYAAACPIHRSLSDVQEQLVLELSRRTFAQMMQ